MGKIIVFGAGGRAGSAVGREACRRGHDVTAVVRRTADHPGLEAPGVRLVAGDVTDPADVARLAPGHDAAVVTVFDPGARPDEFYPAAARALVDGLRRARVSRLISVGVASTLPTASGVRLMDTPGYPQEHRGFLLAHASGSAVLAESGGELDWLVMNPSGDFDHGGIRTGRYTTAPGDAASRVSYDDFAIAVLDEIDTPRHHRTQIGVEQG
ncbi:hypothetical protein SAMN05421505_1272 [Sinosporangium album]|uniref:NAD(P)-binding domain-containing protein n=1 Tax=Sinosporangium album TaxID=504805 RepID=A0A1G8GEP8_9ACTN|nr:NAD(P)H-binding protein [Sinosporangium album]SDH92810.1 hypothetical protein SAMN05421505_1272 [Sinosporangium album]